MVDPIFIRNLIGTTHDTTILKLSLCLSVAGACEYGNELSGSIKCGEFLD